MIKKFTEFCGWLGMVLIHGATVPTMVGTILGENPRLPEFSMVGLVWAGLFFFLIRAAGRKDVLYLVSNGVGFTLNSMLMALIVFA